MVIMIDGRKAIRITLGVILLIVAIVLWSLSQNERFVQTNAPATVLPNNTNPEEPRLSPNQLDDATTPRVQVRATGSGTYDDYRLERDKARSTQIELLRSALADHTLSEARRGQLTTDLFTLLKRSERELQAETLLKAKGYTDAVVVLSESGANAVIPEVLDINDAARVGELVSRATGMLMERITIIDGASPS